MKPLVYVRDKRSPIPANENVSRVMSANKAKNTNPEKSLRKALWKIGLKGYRKNYKKIPGRPDLAFVNKKFAIFVNGCYWHRCPKCDLPLPKTNIDFWKKKFDRNVSRDQEKNLLLEQIGWKSMTVWECELNPKDIDKVIKSIKQKLLEYDGQKKNHDQKNR
ncbi:MAG TPA: very short patch repair endonuclease [Chitinophagaceae bacterium]|nr:very short patch repair endonuclease [Chitinophagaceae bacterium]